MHRIIMNPSKGYEIDHKDQNGLNNQRQNLRIVTRSQNQMNKNKQRNNTSGVRGISWDKQSNGWHVTLGIQNKNICLGVYKDLNKAQLVREQAELKYFKEFNLGYQKGEEVDFQ